MLAIGIQPNNVLKSTFQRIDKTGLHGRSHSHIAGQAQQARPALPRNARGLVSRAVINHGDGGLRQFTVHFRQQSRQRRFLVIGRNQHHGALQK